MALGKQAKILSKQQAWQQERQKAGWKRLSVFLDPDYAAKAQKAVKRHGSLASAVKKWLDAEPD